jgi:hypothetical protein
MDYIGVPAKDKRDFAVIFKDGTYRVVGPQEDPTQFKYIAATDEPPITDPDVRAYCIAARNIYEPTPDEYAAALKLLQEDPDEFERKGAHAILALQRMGKLKRTFHGCSSPPVMVP